MRLSPLIPDWILSLGGTVDGDRLRRAMASDHYRDGRFLNPTTTRKLQPQDAGRTLKLMLARGAPRAPSGPIPVQRLGSNAFVSPPPSGLRVTWMGHAASLLEIDGQRILIDPVWSKRCSPFKHIGPKRFHPPPIALDHLPALDAVLVSHDHYDHLDMHAVQQLARRGVRFITSLGVGAHLELWGVKATAITELDWDDVADVNGIQITALPARHFSGRGLRNANATLWSSWAIVGPTHRVYYSGDSGWFDGFISIGERYGPFDLTLMAIGAYGPTWPDVHVTPEEAVRAHCDVRGRVLLPVHWGTFNLAFHGWREPADRVVAASRERSVSLVTPRPGESIEPSAPPPIDPWWHHVS